MKTTLQVQNLKCGGCANTISSKLSAIHGVSKVEVDVDTSEVSFESPSEEIVNQVKTVLHKIGYPEVGDDNSLGTKAKSYVSCAIGKVS